MLKWNLRRAVIVMDYSTGCFWWHMIKTNEKNQIKFRNEFYECSNVFVTFHCCSWWGQFPVYFIGLYNSLVQSNGSQPSGQAPPKGQKTIMKGHEMIDGAGKKKIFIFS